MPDHVVMPPVPYCRCGFCSKRAYELELAAIMERELYDAANKDLSDRRAEYLDDPPPDVPTPAYAKRRHPRPTSQPAIVRYPNLRKRSW